MVSKKIIFLAYLVLSVFIFSSVGIAESDFRKRRSDLDGLYDELEGGEQASDYQVKDLGPAESKPKKQHAVTPKQQYEQIPGEEISSSNQTDESISHIKKILEGYPGYIDIVDSQIFNNYVNNLPFQQRMNAKRIIESGATNEAARLMTDFMNQKDYQNEHIKMITDIVKNWSGMYRHKRAEKVIQDWIRKVDAGASVTGLGVKETNNKITVSENAYLVYYAIVKGSSKQEYAYIVDTFSNSVRSIYIDSELQKSYVFY